jgi:hypothetical protein
MMKPKTPCSEPGVLAKIIARRVTLKSILHYRTIFESKIHWTGNMAAIIRKNPPEGRVATSFLRNEDMVAALHGMGLGINPNLAVELAYKDLLVFGGLDEWGYGHIDPLDYRLLAAVTEPSDCSPSLAMFAHKSVATYQPEFDADECVLLHDHDGEGEMVLMPNEFWVRYLSCIGMRYDEAAVLFHVSQGAPLLFASFAGSPNGGHC